MMDGKTLARVGAIVFVAVAITATAIEMKRKDVSPDALATQSHPVTAQDPLAAELLRCSEIGEAGTRDPNCPKAWSENRRRFLRQPTPASSSPSAAPTTLFPSAPAGAAMRADPAQPEVR